MEKAKSKVVIFAHSGTYDKLYQVVTQAITAVSMGKEVYIFLFFWALKKFVDGTIDVIEFPAEYGQEGRQVAERMKSLSPASLKDMLKEVRGLGRLKIYACSAQLHYMGLKKEEVEARVDGVLGLPAMLKIAEDSEIQLFI